MPEDCWGEFSYYAVLRPTHLAASYPNSMRHLCDPVWVTLFPGAVWELTKPGGMGAEYCPSFPSSSGRAWVYLLSKHVTGLNAVLASCPWWVQLCQWVAFYHCLAQVEAVTQGAHWSEIQAWRVLGRSGLGAGIKGWTIMFWDLWLYRNRGAIDSIRSTQDSFQLLAEMTRRHSHLLKFFGKS